jgi:c-di-GMP-binding flagellar brake protein YcgR
MAAHDNTALQNSRTEVSHTNAKTRTKSAEDGCPPPVILFGCCIYQERSCFMQKGTDCNVICCTPQKNSSKKQYFLITKFIFNVKK